MATKRPSRSMPEGVPQIEGYRVNRLIGRDDMLIVYQGVQDPPGRPVAIKTPTLDLASDPPVLQAFHELADQLASLPEHVNMVQVLASVQDWRSTHYMVMELVEGRSMTRALTHGGRVKLAESVRVIRDAARALEHVHARGIIHGDVRPANIWVTATGVVKVMDFGLALCLDGMNRTVNGKSLFDPHFMSPEQARGAAVIDGRSDLYSLAAVLYVMTCGWLPFDGGDFAEIAGKHASERPRAPRDVHKKMPEDLEAIILKGLEKAPDDRFQSAAEFGEALDTVLGLDPSALPALGGDSDAAAGGGLAARRGIVAALVSGAVLLAIGIVALFLFSRSARTTAIPEPVNPGLVPVRTPVPEPTPAPLVDRGRTRRRERFPTATPEATPRESTGLLREFEGHSAGVRAVAFSPDGATALTASWDKTIRLWDLGGGAQLRLLNGHRDLAMCVAFSPEGTRAVSGAQDTTCRVWDLSTGKELRTFTEHTGTVFGVNYTPDGHAILSGDRSGNILLWNPATGAVEKRFEKCSNTLTALAMSRDGQLAVSGSEEGIVELWDVESGTMRREFPGHEARVYNVAISQNNLRALSASWDHTGKMWDLREGKLLFDVKLSKEKAAGAAFSRDGRRAMLTDEAGAIFVIDAETGALQQRFSRGATWVLCAAFSPDGTKALTGEGFPRSLGRPDTKGTLVLWGLSH